MPTHWESSERPLFVKTVYVNGNRHAILSQVDPLCHLSSSSTASNAAAASTTTMPTAKKGEGGYSVSYGSPSSINSLESRDETTEFAFRRARTCFQSKRDITSDLQKCLVKLRLVLSTQDGRKRGSGHGQEERLDDSGQSEECPPKERSPGRRKSRASIFCGDELSNIRETDVAGFRRGDTYQNASCLRDEVCTYVETATKTFERETEYSIRGSMSSRPDDEGVFDSVKETTATNLTSKTSNPDEATEEILKNYTSYFFPLFYVKTDDLSWDCISTESYFTKRVHNPLSERVLQWLELAKRRKMLSEKDKEEQKSPTKSATKPEVANSEDNRREFLCRYVSDRSESPKNPNHAFPRFQNHVRKFVTQRDVEEEVKQESDIETALSSAVQEYEKYSRQLTNLASSRQDAEAPPSAEENLPDEAAPLDATNRDNPSLAFIPQKQSRDSVLTEQLCKSILNSFEAMVNVEMGATVQIRPRHKNDDKKSPRTPDKRPRRKGLLVKQKNIRISSDEDEDYQPSRFGKRGDSGKCAAGKSKRHRNMSEHRGRKRFWEPKRKHQQHHHRPLVSKAGSNENRDPSDASDDQMQIIYQDTQLDARANGRVTYLNYDIPAKKLWGSDKGPVKPQLHIFMPGIDGKVLETHEESASDTESFSK